MKKVFLAIGNSEIEDRIKEIQSIDIVDSENNLTTVRDLIDYIDIDYLIINRILDDTDRKISEIASVAEKKNIKIIVLMNDLESFSEKQLINLLVTFGVYVYLNLLEFETTDIINVIESYPEKFNFDLLAEKKVKIIEKEKIVKETVIKTETKVVKKKIITCYTTDDAMLSADISSQISVLFSKESGQSVLVIDFNTTNPILDVLLAIDKNVPLTNKYDVRKQSSLAGLISAIDRNKLDYNTFNKLTIKHPKYNLNIITGLYDLLLEERIDRAYYKKIIDIASELYDIVIINTNPNVKADSTFEALMRSDEILAISKANYVNLRNMLATFKVLENIINKDKIRYVIMDMSGDSLDVGQIKEVMEDRNIISYINYDSKKEYYLNNQKIYIESAHKNIKDSYKTIIDNIDYIPKITRIRKLKNILNIKR